MLGEAGAGTVPGVRADGEELFAASMEVTIERRFPASPRSHRHDRRARLAARRHLEAHVRPSPARAEPHDAAAWLPLPRLETLPDLDDLIAGWSEGTVVPVDPPGEAPIAGPSPARAEPHDAATWLPLPRPDTLPSVEELLTREPWQARPAPGRAKPHDAAAWLPLPDTAALPAITELARGATTRTLVRHRSPWRLGAIAMLVVGTALGGWFSLSHLVGGGTTVELQLDGRRISSPTDAATVGAFLATRGVQLGEHDRVVPAPNRALRDGMRINVLRGFPVQQDLDGVVTTEWTTYSVPDEFVRNQVRNDRIQRVSAPDRLAANATIVLRTVHAGTLVVDGQTVDYNAPAKDLIELFQQYSVVLGRDDVITDRAGHVLLAVTPLVDGEQYTVTRVGHELVTETVAYTLPDEKRPDPTMNVGQTRVEPGAAGVARVTYDVTRTDSTETSRTIVSRVPVTLARATITYYGTKADPMWDRIALCETGGNWAMQGPVFSGGLGFYNGTWDDYGGREFASNAGLATREEQIIVAERVRHAVGISGWGCAYVMGYIK